MAVDEQRFFRLLKLQAGERFFSGAAGGWEGSHFLLCVNHQELGFSKFVFFFWGEDEFKETRKRCWILKF